MQQNNNYISPFFKLHFASKIAQYFSRKLGYLPIDFTNSPIVYQLHLATFIFGEFGRNCCSICINRRQFCPQFNEHLCPTKLNFLEEVSRSDIDKVRFIKYLILSNPRYVQSFAKYCNLMEELPKIFNDMYISHYNRDRIFSCIFKDNK